MEIVRKLAGYSMGRSDLVRRAMSKKKHKVMEEERKNFIYGIVDENGNVEVPGCIGNGIKEDIANKIFDQMVDFASYAFNKSHAAAYAVIAYQTAYLMRYYPTEFIAAMLNSVMGNNEKVAYYVRFANERGIEVLPPNINKSYSKFNVQEDKIIFGMASIKNVGVNVIESIVKSRNEKGNFIDLIDFCNKVDLSCVNKRAVESLIKSGAFDTFEIYRSKMLAVYEKVLDGTNNDRKKNIDGQINLFLDFKESTVKIEYPNINEFDKKYILAMEKEMTGLYISGHPLEEYKDILNSNSITKIPEIINSETLEDELVEQERKIKDGEIVKIGGIITSVNKKVTKNNEMMAFITIEDLYSSIEVIVFPKTFNRYRDLIDADSMVTVKGRVNIREGEQPKILCENVEALCRNEEKPNSYNKIYIRIQQEKYVNDVMKKLKPVCIQYKGNIPIYLYISENKRSFLINKNLWINSDKEILSYLKNSFGEENVKAV